MLITLTNIRMLTCRSAGKWSWCVVKIHDDYALTCGADDTWLCSGTLPATPSVMDLMGALHSCHLREPPRVREKVMAVHAVALHASARDARSPGSSMPSAWQCGCKRNHFFKLYMARAWWTSARRRPTLRGARPGPVAVSREGSALAVCPRGSRTKINNTQAGRAALHTSCGYADN